MSSTNFFLSFSIEQLAIRIYSRDVGASGTGFRLQLSGAGYFSNGLTTQDITSNYFSVWIQATGGGNSSSVQVSAMNNCGVSPYAPYIHTYIEQSWGCYGSYYMMSPNPANGSFTVAAKKDNKDGAYESFDRISIYDQQGNLKLTKKLGKVQTATINISDLINGTYIVEIGNGSYSEKQQLIIQK